MNEEISKKMISKYNAHFVSEHEYNSKKYYRAFKMEDNFIKFYYYEIDNQDELIEVKDKKVLSYFNDIYDKCEDVEY